MEICVSERRRCRFQCIDLVLRSGQLEVRVGVLAAAAIRRADADVD